LYAADYVGTQGIVVDPTGPSPASRGGGWGYSARECRSALRTGISPGYRHGILGFRLVLVPSRGLGSSQQAAGVERQQTAGPEARGRHGGGAARPKAGQKVNASERKKVAQPSGVGPKRAKGGARCVRHGRMTEGAGPFWNRWEVTKSQRQLHEMDAGFDQWKSFPRGRVGWKPAAYRYTERK
jgi:hypothetical protein